MSDIPTAHTDNMFIVLEIAAVENFLNMISTSGEKAALSTMFSAAAFTIWRFSFSTFSYDMAKLITSETNYFLWTPFEGMFH
jgi:hypothetical protein